MYLILIEPILKINVLNGLMRQWYKKLKPQQNKSHEIGNFIKKTAWFFRSKILNIFDWVQT